MPKSPPRPVRWLPKAPPPQVRDRHHDALHNPLPSLMMVGLARYREALGDVISRLMVARYRHVLDGAPLWHVAVQFAQPEGSMRLAPEWTRRDRRRAAQIAEGLLANHGEGLIMDGAIIEGLNSDVALHRLRRVTRQEMACFPDGYLDKPSLMLVGVIDGDDSADPVGADGDRGLPVPEHGVGDDAAGAVGGASSSAAG